MIIRKLDERTIDVFCGLGWNQWSRFEVQFDKGRGSLKLVKGRPMDKVDFRNLYQELFHG
jgi:hypothetical protein